MITFVTYRLWRHPQVWYIACMCACMHLCIYKWKYLWHLQLVIKIFTFVIHICTFTFMITLTFLVLQSYLFLQIHVQCLESHKYFTFSSHICSLKSMISHVLFLWQTFFSFMPINLKTAHTGIYIDNANAYELLSGSY